MRKRFISFIVFLLMARNVGALVEAQDNTALFKLPDVIILEDNEALLNPQEKKQDFSDTLLDFDLDRMSKDTAIPAVQSASPFKALDEQLAESPWITRIDLGVGTVPEWQWSLLHGQEKQDPYYLLSFHQDANQGVVVNQQRDGYNILGSSLTVGHELGLGQEIKGTLDYLLGTVDLPYGPSNGDEQRRQGISGLFSYSEKDATHELGASFSAKINHRDDVSVSDDNQSYALSQFFRMPLGLFNPISLDLYQDASLRWDGLTDGNVNEHYLLTKINAGIFLDPLNGLHVGLGLRWDHFSGANSSNTDNLFVRYSLAYDLFPELKIFVKYAPDLDMPEFEELYFERFYTKINPFLQAAQTYNDWETGITGRVTKEWDFSVIYFWKDFNNFIDLGNPDAFFLWQPVNVGSVNQRGIKLGAEYRVSDSWTVSAEYSYTESSDLSDPNSDLVYLPQNKFSANVFYTERQWEGDLGADAVGSRFFDQQGDSLDPYYLLNLMLKWKRVLPGWDVWVKGSQLLGQSFEIWKGYAQPSSTALLGVTWQF